MYAKALTFTDFFSTQGVEGIKRVVDVYDSTKARGKSHADTVKLLNDNASMFGVKAFNDGLLSDIFNYANSKVGRISGNIKDNPFQNAQTDRKITLETEVGRAYSGARVTSIHAARTYGTDRDHNYGEPGKVIALERPSTSHKKPHSTLRRFRQAAVAAGLVAYFTVSPFSGLFGNSPVRPAEGQPAPTSQPGSYKPKSVEEYKNVLDKLSQAADQKGAQDSTMTAQVGLPISSGVKLNASIATVQAAGAGVYKPKSVEDYRKTLDALNQFSADRKKANDDLSAKLSAAETFKTNVKYDDLKGSVADARKFYDDNKSKFDATKSAEAEKRLTALEDAVKKYTPQAAAQAPSAVKRESVKKKAGQYVAKFGDVLWNIVKKHYGYESNDAIAKQVNVVVDANPQLPHLSIDNRAVVPVGYATQHKLNIVKFLPEGKSSYSDSDLAVVVMVDGIRGDVLRPGDRLNLPGLSTQRVASPRPAPAFVPTPLPPQPAQATPAPVVPPVTVPTYTPAPSTDIPGRIPYRTWHSTESPQGKKEDPLGTKTELSRIERVIKQTTDQTQKHFDIFKYYEKTVQAP